MTDILRQAAAIANAHYHPLDRLDELYGVQPPQMDEVGNEPPRFRLWTNAGPCICSICGRGDGWQREGRTYVCEHESRLPIRVLDDVSVADVVEAVEVE